MENSKEIEIEKVIGWKTNFKNKITAYVKEQPKKAYIIMVSATLFSLLFTIGNMIYTQKVVVPRYEELSKKNIFSGAANSIASPVNKAKEALEIKEVLSELEYFRNKENLTANDSLRIKYLIYKYKKNDEK